ncbi:MAG: ATP-binding protein, partial [Candidatus Altiarchaeota archaeon]|nr:ATP-binding protein [Candidatus Altiarchaeota archaeon]
RRRVELLKEGKRRNLAIIGLRKTGKSSLLLEFMNQHRQKAHFVYIYLPLRNTPVFLDKMIRTVFFTVAYEHDIKLDPVDSTQKIITGLIRICPDSCAFALGLLDKEADEKFGLILDLYEVISGELSVPLVVMLDEFQRITNYDLTSAIDVFREKIMLQKIQYIIAGSAVRMMNEIVTSTESPLYNHFEIMHLKNFDYINARTFVLSKLKGFRISELNLNFLVNFTGGNPFYLDILCFRLKDITEKTAISKEQITDAIAHELFGSSGALYNYFRLYIEESLEKRGYSTFTSILSAIAFDKTTISKIATKTSIPVTSLPRLLNRLIELDLILKQKKNYRFIDPLMLFWFKYVYLISEESYIPELDLRLKDFKTQVTQMILEFKTELGHARESQIREIFTKKGFDVSSGFLGSGEFDLIAEKNKGLLLGECKTGNITIKAVTDFTHKIKEVERKRRVNKKILFTLFTITEKARKLCKKEGVEIWGMDRINKERKKQGLIPLGI